MVKLLVIQDNVEQMTNYVETDKENITKSVKSRTMSARNNEVVNEYNVCREQNLVVIGCSHPHAFFIVNFSATLCFEGGAHSSV